MPDEPRVVPARLAASARIIRAKLRQGQILSVFTPGPYGEWEPHLILGKDPAMWTDLDYLPESTLIPC